MNRIITNDIGKIIVSQEVIATLAGIAATECYGIVGMASQKIKDGIVELLGREALSKGVQVNLKNDRLQINVFIIVGYGTKISEIAYNVMNKVKYTVEKFAGLPVDHVQVNIQGVRVVD
ncbi:MAG: Asp23/Gls24 family envelope stress response protein [Desulfitobacteriaceae bacterium]|nr:Asp23/Gls24 family envelope stress response protein [Desulfitobacteriaceae bacterium]MDD4754227.1 Asp23/Gls24 family envelope stress response protein [Desulfitobacteriaceae bacterium]